MKKLLALFLAITLAFCALPVAAPATAEAESSAAAEAFFDYIESNVTVTHYADGAVGYTLDPVAASLTVSELAAEAGLATGVSEAPAMAALGGRDYGYTTGQTHTWLPVTEKYIYTQLNAEDKANYMLIYNAVKNLEAQSPIIKSGETSRYALYYAVMFDNPELFYLGNTTTVNNLGNGNFQLTFCYAAARDDYCHYGHNVLTPELKERILAKKAVFDNTVKAFVSTIPANAPQVVKERLIYAKILRASYYNLAAQWNGICEDNWNAYGIICNGYGVCESYAEAFQTLCNAVGIQCTGIVGTAGGGHKWNAVKIEGEWYQCDITFDDPIGGGPEDAFHWYFNLTDEEMGKGHEWSNDETYYMGYVNPPVATATKYSWKSISATYEEDSNGTLHEFISGCDTTCENCSYERSIYIPGHLYSDPTDTTCDYCGATRLYGWVWDSAAQGWRFYYDGEPLKNAWRRDSVGWCYLGWDGLMLTDGHYSDGVGSFILDADGHCYLNQWVENYESWFYADSSGYLLRNRWFLWHGKWYYFSSWCGMATYEWIPDSQGECYVGANGIMVTDGWVFSGDWYYVDANGHKVTNTWKKDSKGWVYLGADGAMVTNKWLRDSNGWCYVGWDGYCVTNKWQTDSTGKSCYLNANGNMVANGWVYDNTWHYDSWFYMDANGYKVTGTRIIGGKTHVFNDNGRWLYEVK